MLTVADLRVRYGEMEAVRGISFEVRAGEAVGIIGANGAGKSTTLRALMGLVPAAGAIELQGRSLAGRPPWERAAAGVAWAPEGRRVFGDLTVEENLFAGAYRLGSRRAAGAEAERVYALFPTLGQRRRQLARTLSGGEQQMLAIGRALMARPRLLLVDEASLGLAPILVGRVFAAIGALVRDGVTLLLVEQNVRQALAVVGRAYLLEVGRIVQAGTAAELASDPAVRDAYLGA
jgi:branched-chain amino acid transport system ATP-binding protein